MAPVRPKKTKKRVEVLVRKKPVVLPGRLKARPTHPESAIALYWLAVLALVVLNLFAAIAVSVVQFAIKGNPVLVLVSSFGILFGFVSWRLVSSIDALEPKHNFFAHMIIPAAAIANLLVLTAAVNNFVFATNIGNIHDPVQIAFFYGISFAIPPLCFAAFRSKLAKSLNHKLYK